MHLYAVAGTEKDEYTVTGADGGLGGAGGCMCEGFLLTLTGQA